MKPAAAKATKKKASKKKVVRKKAAAKKPSIEVQRERATPPPSTPPKFPEGVTVPAVAKSSKKAVKAAVTLGKATTSKKAGKKAAATATKVKPDKVEEIDPSKLKLSDAQKRCGSIYALERRLEAAKGAHDVAKKRAKELLGKLNEAEKALGSEIHEQRVGPGPLYNPSGGGKK